MSNLSKKDQHLWNLSKELTNHINKTYSQEGRKTILDILCLVICYATDAQINCHIKESPKDKFTMFVKPKGDTYESKARLN